MSTPSAREPPSPNSTGQQKGTRSSTCSEARSRPSSASMRGSSAASPGARVPGPTATVSAVHALQHRRERSVDNSFSAASGPSPETSTRCGTTPPLRQPRRCAPPRVAL